MKENQMFTYAGDLNIEMKEAEHVYGTAEEQVITLTFDCNGFLTIICC